MRIKQQFISVLSYNLLTIDILRLKVCHVFFYVMTKSATAVDVLTTLHLLDGSGTFLCVPKKKHPFAKAFVC